jgi:predicted dienelactone hydrolase
VLTVDRILLHDKARREDLSLRIYYPDGTEPFPVIIFSHSFIINSLSEIEQLAPHLPLLLFVIVD